MGWGSSTRRGGGRKVRALPRKFVSLSFEGGNLGHPGILPGCPGPLGLLEKFVQKKSLCSFSAPNQTKAGEEIFFTDRGWFASGGFRDGDGEGEGTVKWMPRTCNVLAVSQR